MVRKILREYIGLSSSMQDAIGYLFISVVISSWLVFLVLFFGE